MIISIFFLHKLVFLQEKKNIDIKTNHAEILRETLNIKEWKNKRYEIFSSSFC